jgi:predicted transposase YdaD
MDNEVLGPAIRKGLEEGRSQGLQEGREEGLQQGLQQGLEQGLQDGKKEMLRLLLVKRFGTLPDWAERKLAAGSPEEADSWAVRLLDAGSLRDLFR